MQPLSRRTTDCWAAAARPAIVRHRGQQHSSWEASFGVNMMACYRQRQSCTQLTYLCLRRLAAVGSALQRIHQVGVTALPNLKELHLIKCRLGEAHIPPLSCAHCSHSAADGNVPAGQPYLHTAAWSAAGWQPRAAFA